MRDYINIGSSPYDEDCAQLGADNYRDRARKECVAFIHQIVRRIGKEPDGAELKVKAFEHDFGRYYEVVCYYETDNKVATSYALTAEAVSIDKWDDEAQQELKGDK